MRGINQYLLKKRHHISANRARFFDNMADSRNLSESYQDINPNADPKDPQTKARAERAWQEIKEKIGDKFDDYLALYGLDFDEFAHQLRRQLSAKRLIIDRGEILMDEEGKPITENDNRVQIKALEIFADVLGVRKRTIKIDNQKTDELLKSFNSMIDAYSQTPEGKDIVE